MSQINYLVRDGQGCEHEFSAQDDAAANSIASAWLAGGYSEIDRSMRIVGTLYVETTEDLSDYRRGEHHWTEVCGVSAEIHPDEPACHAGEDHDWARPDFLGGLKENPGVWGVPGGVKITSACIRCGCGKHENTRGEDGTGGHMRTVRYESGEFVAQIATAEDA